MKLTKLSDGTRVSCLLSSEAQVLDHHVEGYFSHGIAIQNGDVVFDVGANIGIFGVRAMQKGPNIQVYAFEPVPTIFECLKRNASTFGADRFHVIECGVSDHCGETDFTYYPNSPALSTAQPEQWSKDALVKAVDGSLRNPPPQMWYIKYLPSFVSRWFASRMRESAEQFTCKLVTLSEIIAQHKVNRVDLLKIDCEGAELECLLGLDESDWPKIKQVVVEVHDQQGKLQQVQNRLAQMGLTEQVIEKEPALKNTSLFNIFAKRVEVTS